MTDVERQIQDLTRQLHELKNRQMQLQAEIAASERQLEAVKTVLFKSELDSTTENVGSSLPKRNVGSIVLTVQEQTTGTPEKRLQQKKTFAVNNQLEDFIGTNVISKVGILVTIVGVFIGAKYAIDNELVSPFMRIVTGYLSAGVLLFTALRLKAKYTYFSSVLMGGGLAVAYFITYIAYSFYALFPATFAFALMLITTAATVGIALWYNQRIIALLGQVAAYGIPFLLGNSQGNVFILFGYITIINFGLLVLSVRRNWKILYYAAFVLTYLIYLLSLVVAGKTGGNISAGLSFLVINFFTFYGTFLGHNIYKKQLYGRGDIAILLLNALFFFFLGAHLLTDTYQNTHSLTWFTVANAAVHLIIGYCIYRLRLSDQFVFQFILGLGLLFITIAVPIELDANWVTLLWIFEATALTYVASKSGRTFYLEIACPLVIISFISLLHDWQQSYLSAYGPVLVTDLIDTPFKNTNFILSLFVTSCFGVMSFLVRSVQFSSTSIVKYFFHQLLPVAFLFILYATLFNEIDYAWDKTIRQYRNEAAFLYRSVTLIIFSCLYFSIWLYTNARRIKKSAFHQLLMVLAFLTNVVFLFAGLTAIGDLRHRYIADPSGAFVSLLLIRYISIAALALLWVGARYALKIFKPTVSIQRGVSTVFNITMLSLISNEFIHWMDLSGYQNQYKLGLSLICGAYALGLLFAGIVKKKKHLRLSAIILFGATLVKLFCYDLASLSTISKTIVLVLLGILLLLASFLYNKYKDLLFSKEEAGV